jgi:hypothetical protein
MDEQRLAEIEEWVGTPEAFMMSRIFDSAAEHEQRVHEAIKELIAEVRWLNRCIANPSLLQ